MKRVSFYGCLAWFSLSLFFLFSLVAGKVANISFYLLMLAAFIHAFHAIKNRDFEIFYVWKQYLWVYLGAIGMVLAVLLHEIAVNKIRMHSYDVTSRVGLLGLLTWGAISLSTRQMKSLRWVFMMGTVIATAKLVTFTGDGDTRVPVVGFISIIALSQLTLLLSIFSVFSIVWNERRNFLASCFLGLAGLVGLYDIFISQTRGAWISIPIFIFLICLVFFKNTRSTKTVLWASVLIIALAGSFSTTSIVRNRVEQAVNDIHLYNNKQNRNTSVGTRFQLWRASWILFSENPIFGVGRDKFEGSLKDFAMRGVITIDASTYPHSHNDILFSMATFGIFGLIGILAAYFAPLYYFVRDMRHSDREIAAAAAMGVSLCLGYIIFGLVDVMFMWRICDIFYSMSIATFLAFIIRKKYELQQSGATH